MIPIVVIISCCCLAQIALAFPHGAPPDACATNLMPVHGGNQAQASPPPYTLTASSRTYSPNKPITVVLKGSGQTFKGFIIQAQDLHTGEPIMGGEWRGTSAKQLPCAAATHINPASKSKVELTWTPKGSSGDVVFVATVVESYDTFYTGIKSSSSRSTSGASNNFYDRDQKRASSYVSSVQDGYQTSADSSPGQYESVSQQKGDEEVIGETDDGQSQDQYDNNYYGSAAAYDPNSGYSQPDYSASSDHAAAAQPPQDQAGYYSSPNYQFQSPPYQYNRPQVQPEPYANFQSPSSQSQSFAQPNYRFPFQQYRAPWNYPRF